MGSFVAVTGGRLQLPVRNRSLSKRSAMKLGGERSEMKLGGERSEAEMRSYSINSTEDRCMLAPFIGL